MILSICGFDVDLDKIASMNFDVGDIDFFDVDSIDFFDVDSIDFFDIADIDFLNVDNISLN